MHPLSREESQLLLEEDFVRRAVAETLARAGVEGMLHGWREPAVARLEVVPSAEVLTKQAAGVLDGTALPGRTWGAEIDGRVEAAFELGSAVEFGAVVVGHRRDGAGVERLGGGVCHVFHGHAAEPAQEREARGAFGHDEDRGPGLLRVDQVALPVADSASLLDVGGALDDGATR